MIALSQNCLQVCKKSCLRIYDASPTPTNMPAKTHLGNVFHNATHISILFFPFHFLSFRDLKDKMSGREHRSFPANELFQPFITIYLIFTFQKVPLEVPLILLQLAVEKDASNTFQPGTNVQESVENSKPVLLLPLSLSLSSIVSSSFFLFALK